MSPKNPSCLNYLNAVALSYQELKVAGSGRQLLKWLSPLKKLPQRLKNSAVPLPLSVQTIQSTVEEAKLENCLQNKCHETFHPRLDPSQPHHQSSTPQRPHKCRLFVECVLLRESCPLIKTKIPSVAPLENQDRTLSQYQHTFSAGLCVPPRHDS